jgi:glycosyltransferase involved in cell wall biosynthesis
MDKNKLFSVIVPCYNSANTLSKCIGSIVDQDFAYKEVIVVLDGKDRQAESILKTFKDVKVFYTPKERSGAPVARNIGFDNSTGDYVLFLDSDSYLKAGALTDYAEAFEKHPDCGFVYSGYRLVGVKESVPSEPFDPYMLYINNYIDTSNPFRREVFVRWDESLKSLQDWDFWIRTVKSGVKGYFLENYYFVEKELPKEGSLSADSHKNWLERKQTVKTKNGLINRDICVTSWTAEQHARRVAKLLEADYCNPMMLASKPHNYKLVYMVGFFPLLGVNNYYSFYDSKTQFFKEGLVKVIQWIGTDVFQMMSELTFMQMKSLRDGYNKRFVQFCQSKSNLEELNSMGLNAELLTMPVDLKTDIKPFDLPKDFTVAIYDHGRSQQDIYYQGLMGEIIKAMPDIKFIYFGEKGKIGKDRNCEFVGHLPIDNIVERSSCLLRITRHDGFPVTPIEFIQHNRPTITNVEMPYTEHIETTTRLTENKFVEIKKDIISKIRELKKKPKLYFNEAKEYYSDYFSSKHLKSKLESLIK